MNNNSKRHPDKGFLTHIIPMKRSTEDGVLISSTNEKLNRPLGSDHDGKSSKILRTDQHDVSKQPRIHLKPPIMSSPDGPTINHLQPSSNDQELEFQGKKHEMEVESSDVMQQNRDEKRLWSDSEFLLDSKNDPKFIRDVSRANWNELKEHHKSKKNIESFKENIETSGNDVRACKDREASKTHEKTEEKEKGRKDESHDDHSKFSTDIHESKGCLKEDGESESKVIEKGKEQKDRLQDNRAIPGGWKPSAGENIAKRREKDPDVDNHERNYTGQGIESEEKHSSDKEGEKDASGHGIQHKKRISRPRGIIQSFNRQPRDEEGTQGKDRVFMITYKVGECIQELLNSWKEFSASLEDKIVEDEKCPTLEIRIPPEHITKSNRQVRGAQLWGTDIYTNDSDLVAVLMHTGYCKQMASLPSHIQELRATIRVLPPQQRYCSTLRNSIHSRPWVSKIDCSFRVEKCCIVKKGGGHSSYLEPQLELISFLEPTLVPLSLERTMNTRASATNMLRQQRFVQEVAVQYNLCNEPWIKYSLNAVSDKGLKKPLYTSARLKRGEVLYLETHGTRYELCFGGEKSVENGRPDQNPNGGVSSSGDHGNNGPDHGSRSDHISDVFRLSRCKKPLPQKLMLSVGVPLPAEYVEVVEENLEWEDVQWSRNGVRVAGKVYPITRIHFLSPN